MTCYSPKSKKVLCIALIVLIAIALFFLNKKTPSALHNGAL